MFIPLTCSLVLPSTETPLSTPLPTLDKHLRGGLPPCTLSEVFGTKSSFKTQFILTQAVRTAIQGSAAILLDSDGSIHNFRLVQIVCSLTSSRQAAEDAVARLHIIRITDWETLIASVHMLPLIVAQLDAKFVAVDSLSSIFRTCTDTAASKRLEGIAVRLRQLAISRHVVVAIINGARVDDAQSIVSAMGEAWRHVIGTRLMMRRTGESTGEVLIVKSGVCPSGRSASFHVNESGITNNVG